MDRRLSLFSLSFLPRSFQHTAATKESMCLRPFGLTEKTFPFTWASSVRKAPADCCVWKAAPCHPRVSTALSLSRAPLRARGQGRRLDQQTLGLVVKEDSKQDVKSGTQETKERKSGEPPHKEDQISWENPRGLAIVSALTPLFQVG